MITIKKAKILSLEELKKYIDSEEHTLNIVKDIYRYRAEQKTLKACEKISGEKKEYFSSCIQ